LPRPFLFLTRILVARRVVFALSPFSLILLSLAPLPDIPRKALQLVVFLLRLPPERIERIGSPLLPPLHGFLR